MATARWEESQSYGVKRVTAFLLRRLLGRLLSSPLDAGQLSVQLSAGALELRDVLLNARELNARLAAASAVRVCRR